VSSSLSRSRAPLLRHPSIRVLQGATIGLYALGAVVVVLQRGVLGAQHTVFKIFRQSFWHLVASQNLYAAYPAEQGGAPADLFKYSPTAALFFAPFAWAPYSWALFGWSLLGAIALYRALALVLQPRPALLASLIVLPDLFASLQACSSNAIVAALIILAFAALERGHQIRGAAAIVAGACVKLFPLAALTFAIFHSRRRRFALIATVVTVFALLLPLAVTSPGMLGQQYRWWYAIERSDARDLAFGLSTMSLVRHWIGGSWPNWPVQLLASLALVWPAIRRRSEWSQREFRVGYLASLLMFAVLFNHQAERASFVIASGGVAIWCVTPPRGTTALVIRTLLALFAVVGLGTLPLLIVWALALLELCGFRLRGVRRPHMPAELTSAVELFNHTSAEASAAPAGATLVTEDS
jgi:glycosyl transferase family 87